MLLKPDHNVWRIAPAKRAAMLIDGANYFAAIRRAMIKAQRSILVAGWDLHAQTRLVGPSGEVDDGYPPLLADFLTALVNERPQLVINLLLWDFPMLYAAERDPFPTYSLRWNTPSQIRFCLDDCVPLGSSQHQKLVVVDDAVAFSGGLDITIRRWDTSAHNIDNPHRLDPTGKPYKPFHDVQMMVDGEAARALGELVRERWACAASENLPRIACDNDPWPDHVTPDFTDVDIGIARTQPLYENQAEVQEVERLFLDMIDAAEHSIYIENQFLTSPLIAEHLAKRLRERPQLEVLLVGPMSHDSWLEAYSMKVGRIGFAKTLNDAGGARVALVYPQVAQGERQVPVMIHAKVMVVDDKSLRVGSANLNNRSMGTDTECDLVIVAKNDAERARVTAARNRLIGDHCGASAEEVTAALAVANGSLVEMARSLRRNGHSLQPIVDTPESADELAAAVQGVADPSRPFGAERFVTRLFGGLMPARHGAIILKAIVAGLLVLGLALIWRTVPLAKPEAVRDAFAAIAENRAAPLIVLAAFIIGGLVAFPVLVLIAATAATFGPWLGFGYAAAGALASALVTYAIGAAIGKRPLRNFLGPKLNRIRQRVARRGVLTVAAVRMVPVAPFTVVNLVAGASGIPVLDYTAGTLLGMLPGLIAISAVGHQFARILTAPTGTDFALLGAAIAVWIAFTFGVQALVSRYWSPAR
ncbi:MAG TPA: VTT domain-containing protein [Pseudolabrys sp.]|nr:VTT domain-containing protein [Pseudolabrys sp.]